MQPIRLWLRDRPSRGAVLDSTRQRSRCGPAPVPRAAGPMPRPGQRCRWRYRRLRPGRCVGPQPRSPRCRARRGRRTRTSVRTRSRVCRSARAFLLGVGRTWVTSIDDDLAAVTAAGWPVQRSAPVPGAGPSRRTSGSDGRHAVSKASASVVTSRDTVGHVHRLRQHHVPTPRPNPSPGQSRRPHHIGRHRTHRRDPARMCGANSGWPCGPSCPLLASGEKLCAERQRGGVAANLAVACIQRRRGDPAAAVADDFAAAVPDLTVDAFLDNLPDTQSDSAAPAPAEETLRAADLTCLPGADHPRDRRWLGIDPSPS